MAKTKKVNPVGRIFGLILLSIPIIIFIGLLYFTLSMVRDQISGKKIQATVISTNISVSNPSECLINSGIVTSLWQCENVVFANGIKDGFGNNGANIQPLLPHKVGDKVTLVKDINGKTYSDGMLELGFWAILPITFGAGWISYLLVKGLKETLLVKNVH